MGTIAKGMITLSTVNDAYTVSLTKSACVIHADYDGSNPQLDNASTTITVKRGDKDMAFTCTATSKVGCEASCNMIGEKSAIVKITSLTDNALSGQVEIQIETEDGYATLVIFSFSVERESTMLDWIQDWEGSKTKVGGTYIMTPKLFVGKKESNVLEIDGSEVLNTAALTGVYIGPDDKSAGIYGYHNGKDIFHLNEDGGMIGGWLIEQGGIQTEDGKLKILSDGAIYSLDDDGNTIWGLYSDGSAKFASGNVKFSSNGDAYFKGEISATKGTIGGWTIGQYSLYNGDIYLSASEKCVAVFASRNVVSLTGDAVKANVQSGGVMMYYASSSDYGLVGYSKSASAITSGLLTFSLGSSNYIAGWHFDDSSLYLGDKNNTKGSFTDASGDITIGTNGLRGYNWCIDSDGHAAFADGVVYFDADGTGGIAGWTIAANRLGTTFATIVSEDKLAGLFLSRASIKDTANASLIDNIENNGGIALYYNGTEAVLEGYNNAASLIFRLCANEDSVIAGWNFSQSAMWHGELADLKDKFTTASGYVTLGLYGLRGYQWRLETDGAGGIAGDKIQWDKDGNITFADSVSMMWQGGNVAQMIAFATMLYRDPEFIGTDFNGTGTYLTGNDYIEFDASLVATCLSADGLTLKGVGTVTLCVIISTDGTTNTFWSGSQSLSEDAFTTIGNALSVADGDKIRIYFNLFSSAVVKLRAATTDNSTTSADGYDWIDIYGYDTDNGTLSYCVKREIVTDDVAPNSTQRVMQITDARWYKSTDFRLGGFHFANKSRANGKFVVKIKAKIPTGWIIENHHNAYGTGGTTKWVTSQEGTGDYAEYICIVTCGKEGTFSTINHFALRRQSSDTPVYYDTKIAYTTDDVETQLDNVVWYVAYATVFDATSSDKVTTTIDANGIYTGTLRADQIIAGTIDAQNISVDGAIISNGDAWALNKDGSGYLANKNISWDKDGNLTVIGEITATSGQIAGFYISGTGLVNTGFTNDAYIIFRNDNHACFAGIGGNVLPASSGQRAVARFENEDKNDWWGLGKNIAVYLSAKNADMNYAFCGIGNGVLNGFMDGFSFKKITLTATNTRYSGYMDLKAANRYLISCNVSGSSILLPTLSDVRTALYIGNSTAFCVRLIICADLNNSQSFTIYGRNSDQSSDKDSDGNYKKPWNTTNYPILVNANSGNQGSIAMGTGDILEVLLVYDPERTDTIGDYDTKYTARMISRMD